MKKFLLTTVALALAAMSGYAQGFVEFTSTANYVWDDFTSGKTPSLGTVETTFLWTTSSTLAGQLSIASTATNAAAANTTWTAIEGLVTSGWNIASNTTSGTVQENALTGSTGFSKAALAGGTQSYLGVPSSGTIYAVVVGWDATGYSTFGAAEGVAPDLGISSLVTYLPGAASNSPITTFNQAGMTAFGVAPAPEPSTIALAGLGVSALVAFRRRNASK